jgi:hypothetical protein
MFMTHKERRPIVTILNAKATLALLALCLGLPLASAADALDSGFRNPPPEARPWVYWFFMDGNMTREGITADLEAMAKAGLGGGIFMEVDVGIPRGPVEFMSLPWQELLRYAVKEAERLGLELTVNASPGWTGSGGPWIRPEQSMQHLVASETNIAGPAHFAGLLARPAPRQPFFGEATLTPELKKARDDFYRDVAVLAFPTPAGQGRIADIDEKALYYRAPYSSQPGVKPFLPAPAEHPALPADQCIVSNRIVDLTRNLSPDGRLEWDVPEGNWTVLRFGRRTTGQTTRPAPLPGLGFECDKFDPGALDAHYAAFIQTLLRGLGPRQTGQGGWTMLHIDSWEMSSQNWTARFREEFQRRRGYDLLNFLPVMTGRVVGSLEVSERFLWDLRQTAQELVLQNHASHLRELGRRDGFGLSIEPYDMNPCADLSLGGAASVPMCEFWAKGHGFHTEFSAFEAASIAHTLGRPIVAAESFTSGDTERWQLYPGALKGQGDWALCAGVNRFVFHRYQHQPWLDRAPGMTMGPYGVHWERTQTWWDMAGGYHQYLARCQFLLRRGLPVADICYLAPEGAPHVFRPPNSATRGDPPDRLGYNFDGCAPEALMDHAGVSDGRLVFPGGMSYRVLVLPRFDTMTPALLRKIKGLVEAGATLVGAPPRKSPGLCNYPQCDAEVERLAAELWGEPAVSDRQVGKGRVIRDTQAIQPAPFPDIYPDYASVARLLAAMNVSPDFNAEPFLRYTHRHDGDADIYFVANPEARPLEANATFRVSGRQPELWDPVTGEQRALPEFAQRAGRTSVPLRFDSHQSFFIVFRKAAASLPAPGRNFADPRPVQEIDGPWEVAFQPNRGAPERVRFDTLTDWSKDSDPGVKYFSGIATYRTQFDWKPRHSRVFLDLGQVQVMAGVCLNGRDLGPVWTAPFRVEVTAALKPGPNLLEIRVANLWPNRLIGDAALPPAQRVAWTTWNPFKKDSPLLPSGLLGPVRLAAEESQSGSRANGTP